MKISVIMPVYLGNYDGCASNREEKFIRAINSFKKNKFDAELIIISDNCLIAKKIVQDVFFDDLSIKKIKYTNSVPKSKLFSGHLRTLGINKASGKYICYLDSDDIIGEKHLETIYMQVESQNLDWAYYNDFVYTLQGFAPKIVTLQHNSIGTSSIIHKRHSKIDWKNCNGYGHDWTFVEKLMAWSKNYDKIYGATYFICHIPNQIEY